MNELLSYVFSPLREGDIALYRGSSNGLAPILLVAAEETSFGCVERLQHEYALRAELDADWAARPIALTHHNDRMTLVLEDPGGVPLDRLLGDGDARAAELAQRGGRDEPDEQAENGEHDEDFQQREAVIPPSTPGAQPVSLVGHLRNPSHDGRL